MLVIVGKQCSDFTNPDGILQIGQMVLSMSVPICVTPSIGHCVYDLRHFKAGHPWCHLECEKYLFCLTHRQPWRVWRVLEGCENLCGKAVKTLFNQHCQWVKDYNDTVCMWCFYFIFTRWLLLKKNVLKTIQQKISTSPLQAHTVSHQDTVWACRLSIFGIIQSFLNRWITPDSQY